MTDVSQLSDADLLAALHNTPDIGEMISAEAMRQGVDPAQAIGIWRAEGSPDMSARSPKGAMGVMQLLPGTAHDLGVDPSDLADNIKGGVAYYKQQLGAFRDPRLAAAAYNAGPGAVQKHGGVPPFDETQGYVQRFADASGAAGMSDDQLRAALGLQPPAAKVASPVPVAARPLPPIAGKNNHGQPLTPPQTAMDVAKSVLSGNFDALSGVGDAVLQASPLGGVMNILRQSATIAHPGPAGATPGSIAPPISAVSSAFAPYVYQPQTKAGQYARTIGAMLPNAVVPGGIVRKAAAVVLPGVLSQAAGDAATRAGAPAPLVTGARMAGAVLGGAGAGIGVSWPAEAPQAATLDEIKAAKDAAYEAVDQSGYRVPQTAVQSLADDMGAKIRDLGGPKAAAMLPSSDVMHARLEALAAQPDGVPLSQLDKFRSDLYGTLVKPGGPDSVIGGATRQAIDDLINGLDAPDIAQARDLNSRYMKMQTVEDKMTSAGLRDGNFNKIARDKLRPLIDPDSSQQIGNLTPDEQAAILRVVKGTAGQKIARGTGRFLGNKIVQAPIAVMTHGVSYPFLEGASAGLNKLADVQTRGAVQRALDLISQGGTSTAPQLTYDPSAVAALPYSLGGLIGSGFALAPAQTLAAPSQDKSRKRAGRR